MAEYKLAVTTADEAFAGTYDRIYVTLFGTKGESKRTQLDNVDSGETGNYTVKASSPLGQILVVKIEKEPFLLNPEDKWFCSKVAVTTPENDVILFPCHRWLSRGDPVELRGGRATKLFEDDHSLLIDLRKKELLGRQATYQWKTYAEGLPYISNFKDSSELPEEMCFNFKYRSERFISKQTINAELVLKGLKDSTDQWKDLEAMKKVFSTNKTPISEYVYEHWMEDEFYGYQFLNATNPNVIRRCSKLPANFPVTEEMVKAFLDGSSLQTEMTKGNIFICDYKNMDGLPTREDKGAPLPLTPGLCLFCMNSEKKLMPIAIQLNQQPSEENAIYLRSDPETDWLLAKIFLKNADTLLNQAVYHLLNTHLLAEVFAIATLRCLPGIHPIHKLLMPHFRYTLQLNVQDREQLGPGGIMAEGTLAKEGITELMRRAHAQTTYSSLCLPENIAARGLESVPNCYYRDDGLKLWDIITSFVKEIVRHYYPSDSDVCKDTELQAWVSDIFTHAFLGNENSGIPATFLNVEEVIKYITMVIFTVSAQHAAVHGGQFDYHSWMPNNPPMLRKAPPTTKGKSTTETILETLPNKGITARCLATAWMLSQRFDFVPLGSYTDECFDEAAPKKMIKAFQEELSRLSVSVAKRNSELPVPYNYLNPAEIENSTCV